MVPLKEQYVTYYLKIQSLRIITSLGFGYKTRIIHLFQTL